MALNAIAYNSQCMLYTWVSACTPAQKAQCTVCLDPWTPLFSKFWLGSKGHGLSLEDGQLGKWWSKWKTITCREEVRKLPWEDVTSSFLVYRGACVCAHAWCAHAWSRRTNSDLHLTTWASNQPDYIEMHLCIHSSQRLLNMLGGQASVKSAWQAAVRLYKTNSTPQSPSLQKKQKTNERESAQSYISHLRGKTTGRLTRHKRPCSSKSQPGCIPMLTTCASIFWKRVTVLKELFSFCLESVWHSSSHAKSNTL